MASYSILSLQSCSFFSRVLEINSSCFLILTSRAFFLISFSSLTLFSTSSHFFSFFSSSCCLRILIFSISSFFFSSCWIAFCSFSLSPSTHLTKNSSAFCFLSLMILFLISIYFCLASMFLYLSSKILLYFQSAFSSISFNCSSFSFVTLRIASWSSFCLLIYSFLWTSVFESLFF